MKHLDGSKPSEKSYPDWLRRKFDFPHSQLSKAFYESRIEKALDCFKSGPVWGELGNLIKDICEQYKLEKAKDLMGVSVVPELVFKPHSSVLDKSYRKNVLYNPNWPDPPLDGWILPENWGEKLNDLIRCNFQVKYLDGTEYLLNALSAFFQSHCPHFEHDYEAREKGYYAIHCYTKFSAEVPSTDWNTEEISFNVEIQISTEFQQLLKSLTHKIYETDRGSSHPVSKPWQWDYESEQFSVNYLGHMIHYLESRIAILTNNERD